jgi:sporulation protein YlmC with PRC-barrel domain
LRPKTVEFSSVYGEEVRESKGGDVGRLIGEVNNLDVSGGLGR